MNGHTAAHCRRIVLELRPDARYQDMLRLIAEFARLLDIGIHGLFVEDEGLLSLAALPFAREIRLPTFDWHALDIEQMASDLRQSTAYLRTMLDEAARRAGVPSSFETLHGAQEPAGTYQAGDIVIAHERRHGGGGHGAEMRTGFTLLVPARLRRQAGPFSALLTKKDETVLDIASRFAVAAHERLVLLSLPDDEAVRRAVDHAVALGLPRHRISHFWLKSEAARDIIDAAAGMRQRLIVMPPPQTLGSAWQIAIALGVPVLLAEPCPAM